MQTCIYLSTHSIPAGSPAFSHLSAVSSSIKLKQCQASEDCGEAKEAHMQSAHGRASFGMGSFSYCLHPHAIPQLPENTSMDSSFLYDVAPAYGVETQHPAHPWRALLCVQSVGTPLGRGGTGFTIWQGDYSWSRHIAAPQ